MRDTIDSLAIGAFDGMHLGHKALFERLGKRGGVLIIEKSCANITPGDTRCEFVEHPCFFYRLENIKHLDAEGFVEKLKRDFVNLKRIVVGYDFAFGAGRRYGPDDLKRYSDFEVEVVDEVKIDGISVHSRVIREYIKSGDIETATRLLGHSFFIEGEVVKGQGLGSRELVPTLNLSVTDYVLPKEGVYATLTDICGYYEPSVTFIGRRATTDGKFGVETHIIGKTLKECKDSRVRIIFLQRIRDNRKFDSLRELKKAIESDIQKALAVVKKHTI